MTYQVTATLGLLLSPTESRLKSSASPADTGTGRGEENENVQDTQKGRNALDRSAMAGTDIKGSILNFHLHPAEQLMDLNLNSWF